MEEPDLVLDDGKYTLTYKQGEGVKALRYGEPWRDFLGDSLILTLFYTLAEARDLLKEAIYNGELDAQQDVVGMQAFVDKLEGKS